MLTDFLISTNGDISFVETKNETECLKINFYNSVSNALKINFDISSSEEKPSIDNALIIRFNMLSIKNNKRALLVNNDAYIMQQIFIRLKTSLGELPLRPNIGSSIETVMHKDMFDKSIHKKIENIVAAAIGDLISDFSVRVTPTINKVNGYAQVINICVYNDNKLLYSQEMEW